MSATTWFIIAIVGFSLSGIFLIAAVILFIKLNIPAVIGDLSGNTVARQIKAIREANEASGQKIHRSSHVNLERGMLTEKVKESEQPANAASVSYQGQAHSSKRLDKTASGISANLQNATAKEMPAEPVQRQSSSTEVLSNNIREVNLAGGVVTEVLPQGKVTAILNTATPPTAVLPTVNQESPSSTERQTEVLQDGILPAANQEVSPATAVLEESQETPDNLPAESSNSFIVTRSQILIHTDEVI